MRTILLFYIVIFMSLTARAATISVSNEGDSTTAAIDTAALASLEATCSSASVQSPLAATKPLTLYDMPYSRTRHMENWGRLAYNTATFAGAGVVTLLVLECLPEGATAWDKSEIKHTPFWHRYGNHVKEGPVWDKDNAVFNYVLHPYGGAVYYMSARSNGFNILGSMLYATFVSNVLWEYGIEAFMEIPSIQDMIITPIAGTVIGEGFYRLKRKIVQDDYRLFGSRAMGVAVAWIVDPINEFVNLFAGNPCKRGKHAASITCSPSIDLLGRRPQVGFTAVITL